MGGGSAVDRTLISYLESHQGSATYLVAGFGSGSTESLIIATGKPVMTIGGFSGSDPAPTLAQFRAMVRSGAVRYVLIGGQGGGPGGGGFGGGPGGNGAASSISAWVTAHGTTVNYGGSGSTLYDVSAAA
jgi:4-amino-4-deoxy-L-arabinose transferase-like glycosyltransferase